MKTIFATAWGDITSPTDGRKAGNWPVGLLPEYHSEDQGFDAEELKHLDLTFQYDDFKQDRQVSLGVNEQGRPVIEVYYWDRYFGARGSLLQTIEVR